MLVSVSHIIFPSQDASEKARKHYYSEEKMGIHTRLADDIQEVDVIIAGGKQEHTQAPP